MFWEIGLLAVLIVANGCFSMAELAIISSRKARLQKRAEQGDDGARDALTLANSPSDFLAAVQVGLTLIGVVTGAFGGATLANRLGEQLNKIDLIAPHGESAGFFIVVGIITYFSLVVGELVPKRLALNNPEGIASFAAKPMKLLMKLASPVVSFLSWSTETFSNMMGHKHSEEPTVTEEEVRGLIDQGLGSGVFHQKEKEMVEGVFRLDQQLVSDLMTPASRITWLNLDEKPEEGWRKIVASGHSRFPVYQGGRDNLAGIVSVKALWANMAMTGTSDLRSVLNPPLVVPESMLALKLLETFRQKGLHMALVADEFGTIQGLVTLHDIMESIVGLLPDKGQRSRPGARKRDDGSWLVDAGLDIAEVKQLLRIKRFPGEERGEFLSLGGFLIDQLERIPSEGDRIVAVGHVFEVIDMDRSRIDKILVSKVGAHAAPATPSGVAAPAAPSQSSTL